MFRVREICAEKGITLRELAMRLGITYQSLYESLRGNPSFKRLSEIADILGVDVIELFPRPGEIYTTCPHCGKEIAIKLEIPVTTKD